MVDSNDKERIGEAREELMRMLAEDELRDAVLLIFANKQVHVAELTVNSYLVLLWLISKTKKNNNYKIVLLTGSAKCNECSRNNRQTWTTFFT